MKTISKSKISTWNYFCDYTSFFVMCHIMLKIKIDFVDNEIYIEYCSSTFVHCESIYWIHCSIVPGAVLEP